MDQNQNPNYRPEDEAGVPPNLGSTPPPDMNDSQPPQYGDPVNPQPASPPPVPPPPGLAPGPASTPPPPPNYGSQHEVHMGNTGSLTNPSKDERNWAMFSHLSGLIAGFVLSFTTMPFLGFLGPLVIYLMKKDESAFIADQSKEALNFNITVGIIMAILWVLTWTVILALLTIPLMILVGLGALILTIVATIKSSNGEVYRYPLILRLVN